MDKIKGIGVLPTDTLYGLVCSALDEKAVEKLYQLKERNLKKPFIILISSLKDLDLFKVKLPEKVKEFWPGKVSIVLPCASEKFTYLHKGLNSLAFRWPKDEFLRKILLKTGPLVAPSCNKEGEKPAETIKQAKEYFPNLDFYINKGVLKGKPSKIIKIEDGKVIVLRK